MPLFHLVPTKQFEDDFKKLPAKVQGQVLKALQRIERAPHRAQKLAGVKLGRWRYRVGDYRIRYDIEKNIIVLKIVRYRKEVYRG